MPLTSFQPSTPLVIGTSARLPLAADRAGPCVRVFRFVGIDLSAWTLAAQIRLAPDTPGTPLVALAPVAAEAEGLHTAAIYQDELGRPVSELTLRLAAATMVDQTKIPYAGELGNPWTGAYAIVGAPASGDQRTLVAGDFVALPTTFGSDNAPANRPAGTGGSSSASAPWSQATLTFTDGVVTVAIDGAQLLGPLVARAEAAVARADGSAAQVQAAVFDLSTPVDELLGSPHCLDGNDTSGNTYLREQPATHDGVLTKVQLFVKAAGPIKIKKFSVAGAIYTQTGSVVAQVNALGPVTLTTADFGAFPVSAGECLGFYSDTNGGAHVTFQGGTQDPVWAATPRPATHPSSAPASKSTSVSR